MSKDNLIKNSKSKKICSNCGKSPANYKNHNEKYLCINCVQDSNSDGFFCTKCGNRIAKDKEGPGGYCIECSWKD